jgi:hypothetical protein
MTPEQASAALAQKSEQFAAQVPSAEAVQDLRDAELRLAALTADPDWVRRFQQGSIAEREEYERLTQTIAAAAGEDGLSVHVGQVETVEGPHGVRRQDMIAAIEHLSKVGIPEEGVVAALTGDFPQQDIEWAQGVLEKGMATPEWRQALLNGDPTVLHEWTALCAVVSAGKAA